MIKGGLLIEQVSDNQVEFSDLTDKQKEAVKHRDGSMLVFAGAGTGKTTVLENRYDHLINSGTAKDEILLTSFNKTAVAEIKERIDAVNKFENTHISTVHGLALKIVKENTAGELDVYDTETNEKQKTIENVLKDILVNQNRRADSFNDLSIDEDLVSTTAEVLKNNIDLIRNQELTALEDADELIDKGYEIEKELYGEEAATLNNLEDLLKKTIQGFGQHMEENQRIDFVGMQFQAYKMLNENENILNKYQNRWSYIMVDEAQDLSLIQWKLLDLIAKDSNLALIGDDSQAIYGWRGSNYQFMHDFKDKYDADTITLDTSFRSTTQILEAVNDTCRELEGGVKEKILDSFEGEKEASDGHPKVSSFDTFEYDESKAIAYKIEQLLADGYKPDDIAVVSRFNYPLRLITSKLRKKNIPCVNEKAYSFTRRSEVTYILSLLKAYSNPEDDNIVMEAAETHIKGLGEGKLSKIKRQTDEDTLYESLATLTREDVKGVGNATAEKANKFIEFLESLKHSDDPIDDITSQRDNWKNRISDEIKEWGSERANRVNELKNMIYDGMEDFSPEEVSDAVEEIMLLGDDETDGKVVLTNTYKAKGREWKVVFIPCLNQGFFPSAKSDDQTEEQRVFYVSVSRAKEKCYLSYSEELRDQQNRQPSEFLNFVYNDLGEALRYRNWF